MTLLREIEHYLRRSGTSPTRFGRESVCDPQLVYDLRRGREPGSRIAARIRNFIEAGQ